MKIIHQFIEDLAAGRKKGLWAILLLTCLVFSNIFGNDFVMDDNDFILFWPLIQDLNNFPAFFGPNNQPPGEDGIYSPLKILWHALIYHVCGSSAAGYHLISLMINLTAILLVYRIVLFITKENLIAFLSTLLFAVHPTRAESITFMTASIDMLGIVFLFASFYLYLAAASGKEMLSRGRYLWSLGFAALAIFSYELALSLPFLILFYGVFFSSEQKPSARRIAYAAPYFAIAVVYAWLKWSMAGGLFRGGYVEGSFYTTMMIMIKALAQYVLISLWPITLVTNHELAPGIFSFGFEDFHRYAVLTQTLRDSQTVFSLFLIVILIYSACALYREHPMISLGIGWFFISLLPVMNIVPSGILFGERYLYPGSLGFSLIMAYLFSKWIDREGIKKKERYRNIVAGIFVALVAFYGLRTWLRNQDWKDELTFFKKEAETTSQSALMNTNLGIVYTQYDMPEKALESFAKALKLKPDDPAIYFSQGKAYVQLKDFKSASMSYRSAIQLQPEYPEAYYNLTGALGMLGDMAAARRALAKAAEQYRALGNEEDAQMAERNFKTYFEDKDKNKDK